MSHAVMRGSPTEAQLHLDGILDELVAESGRQEDRYCLAKIFFKCFRDNPQDIRQIEGSTGAEYTNRSVLEHSVRAALALQAAGAKPGQTVLLMGRNHLELTAAYFGTIFAGGLLFPLHMEMTTYELIHFFRISEPVMIFTEVESLSNIEQALSESGMAARIIVFGERCGIHTCFSQFISGFDELIKDFRPVDSDKDSPVMLMSTSGSTGFPKATVLANRGLVAQLPSIWESHVAFPKPTSLYMNCSTVGWIAHTIGMQCTAAYRVPMLTNAGDGGLHAIRESIRKYRPSCTFLPTYGAACLLQENQPGDLSCFDFIFMGGSAVSDQLLGNLRRALRPTSSVVVVYGMTEAYGIYVFQRPGSIKNSVGFTLNTTLVKIVDEKGNTTNTNVAGELYYKSKDSMFTGYFRDEAATKEMFTEDGWLKTGDMLRMDEQGELYFVERIKFLIRSGSTAEAYNVYPTEVEHVISQLEGVEAVAVCGAERGPAALVVPRPGCNLTPQLVHDAVNSALSDMKRLRGGVALIPFLPLLPSRKVDRKKLQTIFSEINESQIYYSTNT